METRTIAIANTKTQTRHQINTSATTLGELQDEMAAQGIDYTGMTFTEGISKTQLLSRDSLLPTNVMYKGQPTNNLVILLTNASKKIESGADRKEAYRLVKELCLQDAILEGEGVNYTRVKTDTLMEYVNNALENHEFGSDYDIDKCVKEGTDNQEKKDPICGAVFFGEPSSVALVDALYNTIKYLAKTSLRLEDVEELSERINSLCKDLKEKSVFGMSDKEIDDIIASM